MPNRASPSARGVERASPVFFRSSSMALRSLFCRPLAKTHPVPLDKNVDSAKCLECHEDKTKGKSVHSAIATGCLSCHEVRVNKDVTRVKLNTAMPYKLCLTCHSDKDATQIKGHVHKPAVRDCLTCHDPHTSDNKNQLLKATSGDKKDNLCLTCHKMALNVPARAAVTPRSIWAAIPATSTHKTGADPTLENRFHLTKAAPALCVDCHDVKDAALQKAHQNQPFGTANCLQCHDPHQSAAPKLMAKFHHPPFADKTCEICHAPAKDGKVVLTQASAKELCATCHDDRRRRSKLRRCSIPGAAGECTDCHNPHAGATPGFIAEDRSGQHLPGLPQRTGGTAQEDSICTSRFSSRDARLATSRMAERTSTCCVRRT